MRPEIEQHLRKSLEENGLAEHNEIVKEAWSKTGIQASERDVKEIVKVLKDEIQKNNEIKMKSLKDRFETSFKKHPEIIEILNNDIHKNNEINTSSLQEKLRGVTNEKTLLTVVKRIDKIADKIQKDNKIKIESLKDALWEHFKKESEGWDG
jgi:hypothetical protein